MDDSPRPSLWAHQDFLKLWAGQTVSQFGSQITFLALPLVAALLLNASPLEMGVLAAAEMAPFLLIGLPAGVWVDRTARRPILILGDFSRAVVLASIPAAALLGLLTMNQLYVVAFLVGIATVFFDVAYMSYLPSMVHRASLVEGNSKLETSRAAAQVAGPGVGGVLVQVLSAPVAIAVDSLTFLVSGAFVLAIRAPEAPPKIEKAGESLRREIAEGIRYVFTHALLRPIASSTATFNLFAAASGALYVLFAVNELDLDAALLGFIFAVGNVGLVLGAVFAGGLSRRYGLGNTITGAAAISGLAALLVPIATPQTAVALLISSQAIAGMCNMVYNINQVSLRQAITPARVQGRMNATIRFTVWGTMPIGALIGGVIGEALGLRPAMAIAAVGTSLAFLWLVRSPVRGLREQPASPEG